MSKIYFITGTDTNIGKTTITVELLKQAKENQQSAIGLKPVASGCSKNNNKLYNSDALLLQKYSSLNSAGNIINSNSIKYEEVNPYSFELPVSPHLVNKSDSHYNETITANNIASHCLNIINKYTPDICYIEGAGGWLCPLNETETFADIAISLNKLINTEIIIVIGIKLGCLNHGVLTYNQIHNTGLNISGWIANLLDPDASFFADENIKYLQNKISAPLLRTVDYNNI